MFITNFKLMNTFLKSFLCVSVLFFSLNVYSQKPTKEEKKLLKKSRKYLANEKYTKAQESYSSLLKLNPKSDVYNFEKGLSYYFSEHERSKSLDFFKAALANTKEDTIPELLYYLGKSYQLNYQFTEAKEALTNFKDFIKAPPKGKSLLEETERSITHCENGIELTEAKDNNVEIKNLGNNINTLDREYAPVFRTEHKVILFTSRRKSSNNKIAKDLLPYEDIFIAKQTDDDNWTMIDDREEIKKHLPANYNTKKHDAGVIYSIDGNTLYTYKKDVLWKSEFKDGTWTELERLSDNINDSRFNVPSITVTQDGKTLFFVATKKDGVGGKDIYKSTIDENGNWNSPELLTVINTPEDEDGPFLSEDGKTLYFSSKGHSGIGGYDFYKSEIVDGNPTEPVNLGIPVNSPFDDIYMVVDNKTEIGFFSSDRDGGFGAMDIYQFDMSCPNIENTEIKGIVYNQTEKLPLQATLTLTDVENSNSSTSTKSLTSNGKFLLVAPPEKSYTLSIEATGFEKQTISIDIPKQCEYYSLFVELALEKAEKNGETTQTLTARNSFFNREQAVPSNQDISTIENEVPFIADANDKDFDNDKKLIAFTRTIDTANTDLNYSIVSNTINYKTPVIDSAAVEYKELFAYNGTEINSTTSEYTSFVNKVVAKVNAFGKVDITIESSASKVPTTTYKSNINLTSIRGDKAKETILKSLADKGIDVDKVSFSGINSVINGPKYTGDYQDTKKYKPHQYVKFTVK